VAVVRRAAALAALVLAAPATPPGFAAGFDLGHAVGDVRPTSAVLWTRAPAPGPVTVFVFEVKGDQFFRKTVRALRANDLTVEAVVTGLEPATEYRFSFLQGTRTTPLATFRTAPAPGADVPVRFAWSGDSDGTVKRTTGKPAFGPFAVLDAVVADEPAFFVYLGDTIYSDSAFGRPARTLAAYRAKYRQNRSIRALRELLEAVPVVAAWDDHEVRNDWNPATVEPHLLAAGREAFHEYLPVEPDPSEPLYRSFRWGRHLEVFVLDLRSYRSEPATTACQNPPGGGVADVAPTLPQAVRDLFKGVVGQLGLPVPPECTAALADPARTLLGRAQRRWLERGLARSSATWKVVMTPDPIQEFALLPYDRWEGYAAERAGILDFITKRRIRNVVWLAADTHATLVKDVTLGGKRTGMVEVVTGPIGTNTFEEEVGAFAGAAAGSVVGGFLKTLGARCAVLDEFSYGHVEASRTKLVVDSRDADGRSVCGQPLVLRAR
jgi:alkaline phosphatase D